MSPLNYVEQAHGQDQIEIGDIAILAGKYMLLAVPDDNPATSDVILTNCLQIVKVAEEVKRLRRANRVSARGANRQGTSVAGGLNVTRIQFV